MAAEMMQETFIGLLVVLLSRTMCESSGTPPRGYSGLQLTNDRCGSLTFNDEFWMFEWYLRGYNPYPLDMNVVPAWKKCYNGTGVIVGVVDGGVNNHNVDLQGQMINQLKYDPMPHETHDLTHGTRIAGIIAAKENNIRYGVGIAFGAKLADIRILIDHPNAQTEAKALVQGLDCIDIYCCAFTHFPSGFKTYPLDPKIESSLIRGTRTGRREKGSIYVWATGNGGENFFRDSCAYEGYNNNIYVISVAGVDNNLKKLPTGEQCSAIMVTGLSRDPNDPYATMITTDGTKSTNNFGRNSAAVAMISGAISLALQANPHLSYRDIMHLLARSSRNDDDFQHHSKNFSPNDFETNGAGYRVSRTFGFGLLDVDKMVRNAKNWRSVGRRIDATYSLSNETGYPLTNFCQNVPQNCPINHLEHVEVTLELYSKYAGGLVVSLNSSNGHISTSSQLLPGRYLDRSSKLNMKVMTVKFWGEDPRSRKWCITVDPSQRPHVSLYSWNLTLHGTSDLPSGYVYNGKFG